MDSPPQLRLSPAVRDKLAAVRGLLRKYVVWQTGLMIACWCLFLFWFGGLIDYMPVTFGSDESSPTFRGAVLLAMGIGSLVILLVWCAPRLFARLRNSSLALLIEQHHPELDNHLVTAVELDRTRDSKENTELSELIDTDLAVSDPQAHQAMLQRVHAELDQRIQSVVPSRLFNWQPVVAAATCVLLSTLITLLGLLVMPSWMSQWSQRLFALSDTPWPRLAELRADGIQIRLPTFSKQLAAERKTLPFVDGKVTLARGATALLQVSAQAESKRVPEVCTLFYSALEDGTRGRANLRRIGSPRDGWQQFILDGPPLDGLDQAYRLSVSGLDARLRDLRLEVIEPPLISKLQLKCEYPDYLNSPTRPASEILPYRTGLRVPEGTKLTLLGECTSALSEVHYAVNSSAGSDNAGRFEETVGESTSDAEIAELEEEEEEELFEILTAMPLSDRPNNFEVALGYIASDLSVEVRVQDVNGITSEQVPSFSIIVQSDTAPEVESQLVGIGTSITPSALLPIKATVKDDYAVQHVQAELISGEDQTLEVPLDLPDKDDSLEGQLDLLKIAEAGSFALQPGDTLAFVLSATDYFDLQGKEQTGRGQPKQLAVVSEDELLVLLDRKELEMRQRLEQIMFELEQLRGALQSLTTDSAARQPMLDRSAGTVRFQDPEDDKEADQRRRLRVIRAQQGVLQGDKSQQELLGVATGIQDLRLQLQNNRIDSYDRQERLQEKVFEPLTDILERDFVKLTEDLLALQSAAAEGGTQEAMAAVDSVDSVLRKLQSIKENMLDIESFNEIIGLVRGLLEEQEALLEETKKVRRDSLLDSLE